MYTKAGWDYTGSAVGGWACPAAIKCVCLCMHSHYDLAPTVVGIQVPCNKRDKKADLIPSVSGKVYASFQVSQSFLSPLAR